MHSSSLDSYLPVYDFGHRHAIDVPAPPSRVFETARRYSLARSATTRLLFRLRGLPPAGPFLASLRAIGFEVFAETPDCETVVGLAARLLTAGRFALPLPARGAAAFRDLALPRTLKIVASLGVRPRDGGSVLETETRVLCTDRAAWALFAPYWAVIRLPGGLIRRRMLAGSVGRSSGRPLKEPAAAGPGGLEGSARRGSEPATEAAPETCVCRAVA